MSIARMIARRLFAFFADERQDMGCQRLIGPVLARHLRLKLVPTFALCFRILRDVVGPPGWSVNEHSTYALPAMRPAQADPAHLFED